MVATFDLGVKSVDITSLEASRLGVGRGTEIKAR